MRVKPSPPVTILKVVSWLMFLVVAFCLWKSAHFAYLAMEHRPLSVKVLGAGLTLNWFDGDSDTAAYPWYELALDLKAEDGSERTFSWQVEAGRARYLEEALDVYADWAPGTVHQIHTVPGQSRQIRFADLGENPESNQSLSWAIVAAMAGVIAGTLHMFASKKGNPGLILIAFGLMPMLGGVIMGVNAARDLRHFVPVEVKQVKKGLRYDLAAAPPYLKAEPKAAAKFAEYSSDTYDLFEYQLDGKKFRLGSGHYCCGGSVLRLAMEEPEDAAHPDRYFVSTRNRWEFRRHLEWFHEVIFIPGMLLGFGAVFIGLGALFCRN